MTLPWMPPQRPRGILSPWEELLRNTPQSVARDATTAPQEIAPVEPVFHPQMGPQQPFYGGMVPVTNDMARQQLIDRIRQRSEENPLLGLPALVQAGSMIPTPIGDLLSAVDAAVQFGKGDVKTGLLALAGALPLIPGRGGKLVLEHRTPSELRGIVDPKKMGTGPFRGAEAVRREAFPNDFLPRSYWTRKGAMVEERFRGYPVYEATIDPKLIYDYERDPLKLMDRAEKLAVEAGEPGRWPNIYENLIRQAGYAGYEAQHAVAIFDPLAVRPQSATAPATNLGLNSKVIRSLRGAEQTQVKRSPAVLSRVIEKFDVLPGADVLSSAALAGKVRRSWYRESGRAFAEFYGEDAPRFTAVLAAMSPQTPVSENLANTIKLFGLWEDAGRPKNPERIAELLAEAVPGERGAESVLGSWRPNVQRALTADDPVAMTLSGPKVDSFMRNLLGDTEAVTLDTWMGKLGAVDTKLFGGTLRGSGPGKSTTYLAYSAQVRDAARRLSRMTGEPWAPSEVQAAVWSWGYALDQVVGRGVAAGTSGELVKLVDALLEEHVKAVPTFETLLRGDRYADILKAAGREIRHTGTESIEAAVSRTTRQNAPGVGYPVPQRKHLRKLARNIERHTAGDYLLRPTRKE